MSSKQLEKSYEPAGFESRIYKSWEEAGCFEAADENAPGQKSFCIVIPPPNVTGVLHMGHALTNTIQDILVRWRRMKGDNALWLPGTDHAGIATQAQVEKQIAKEGKGPTGRPLTRHDLGREKFLERTWKWKNEHADQIKNQLRRLGSSLDWKRERFTMDEGLSAAVREVFVRLYEEKLIYRGSRIINWCPRCQTALSDLEVIPTDRKGNLFHLIYKIDGSSDALTIATTRPETLLGDTAVAVHPEDDRYKHLKGKQAVLPLLGRKIPIIQDEYVDREFGTGALKVTPAHDFNDYDLGKKHNLPFISVIGKDGRITADGGPYTGLKYVASQNQPSEAREKVVADLKDQGLLVKVEEHAMKVGLCQRCESVAEPIISDQWFVKIEPLAKPARDAVTSGKIQFTPRSWEKTYFEWMNNIRDWCISRQLWWGHQIPAWYCADSHITVSRTVPTACAACGKGHLKQDEDVLDTWFSSGLWPFSTLGWPENTKALKTFYPNSIMETGFDIIFFWVARMIMMGIHFMKEVPFEKIYLHAMVRDEKGEKMSKSKGNVIDPLVLIDAHGADPLRFTLTAMAGQGRDIKLSADRVEGYRAFCNKLWNATKFFHLHMDGGIDGKGEKLDEPAGGVEKWLLENRSKLMPHNRWILSRLQGMYVDVERGLEGFNLDECARALYELSYADLCDWYIELAKLPISEGGGARKETLYTLRYVLGEVFAVMHPFMPFVTEELWLSLPWRKSYNSPTRVRDKKPALETLMFHPYPSGQKAMVDADAEKTISGIRAVVEMIRNFRGENNISPKVELEVGFRSATSSPGGAGESERFLEARKKEIMALARLKSLSKWAEKHEDEAVLPIRGAALSVDLALRLGGLVDAEAEATRLKKEIEKVKADIEFVANKLSKESFIAKAPPELVEKEKKKQLDLTGKLKELEDALKRTSKLK